MSDGWRHAGSGPAPGTPPSPPQPGAAPRRSSREGSPSPVPPARPQEWDDFPRSQATPSRPGAPVIRPMPQATESFEAIALRDVLDRPAETQRYEAPPPEPDADAQRGFPVRAVLAVLLAVALVGIAGGVIYVTFFRRVAPDPLVTVTPTATATEHLATPQEAVRGYLEALAAGDIERAMSFGPRAGSGTRVMLTPEAYQRMPEKSRPSNIEILSDAEHLQAVPVRYQLNGKQVDTEIGVKREDTGSYRLARTTVTIQLQLQGGDNLPMLVNETPLESPVPIEVVPGTYELTTGLPFITYTESLVTIQSLAFDDVTQFPVDAELTQAGRDAFLKRARQSLDACLASKELAPAACPNRIKAPKPVKPGAVEWSLKDATIDPWKSVTASLSPDDKTRATVSVALDLKVRLQYQDGATSGDSDASRNATVTASMTGQEADDIQVVWS